MGKCDRRRRAVAAERIDIRGGAWTYVRLGLDQHSSRPSQQFFGTAHAGWSLIDVVGVWYRRQPPVARLGVYNALHVPMFRVGLLGDVPLIRFALRAKLQRVFKGHCSQAGVWEPQYRAARSRTAQLI